MTNKTNPMKLKTLEDRVTKLESFITERLDSVINSKINSSEKYLLDKIDELDERLNDEINDVRGDVPDTYYLESDIEDVGCDVSDLESRVNDIERRLSDLE